LLLDIDQRPKPRPTIVPLRISQNERNFAAATAAGIKGSAASKYIHKYIQCEPSIFEKVFIWFLGQPVVWSESNISQIEAWSLSIYAWYQELKLEFFFNFFLISNQKFLKKFFKIFKKKNQKIKINF
jgi:hypothetical protein